MKLSSLAQGGWVVIGQAATAIGAIVGIRVLTQYLQPETFGTVSLAVGVAALLMNVGCTPLTQAAIHFYPQFNGQGATGTLWNSLLRTLRGVTPWMLAVIVVGGALLTTYGAQSWALIALVAALLACECWRSINLSLLNAASRHRSYGLWMALDASARPALAVAAVLMLGESAASVLLAYVVASVLLALVFRSALADERLAVASGEGGTNETQLDRRMWRYALPLVPLGLIGWANGVADRYIIGGLLSVADAGIYAAAYALASRPLLILNSTIEQALRPIYQGAVSAAEHGRADRLLRIWLVTIILASAAVVLLISGYHHQIAAVLLGERFRTGSHLMPCIALGYALLCIAYVFERVCYAHASTHRVLIVQACTAVAAIIATSVGALQWGLAGAAAAVPVYFSVHLAAAMLFARRTHREISRRALEEVHA